MPRQIHWRKTEDPKTEEGFHACPCVARKDPCGQCDEGKLTYGISVSQVNAEGHAAWKIEEYETEGLNASVKGAKATVRRVLSILQGD